MAKIVEETFIIKVSKLVKDDAENASLTGDDFTATVEAVTQEMVDAKSVVEVFKAE